jgi:hypothetical protein
MNGKKDVSPEEGLTEIEVCQPAAVASRADSRSACIRW